MLPVAVTRLKDLFKEYRPDKLLYPDRCYLCNEILTVSRKNEGDRKICLCPDCEQSVPYVRAFCMKCGRETDGREELCERCSEGTYSFDAGRSLLVYTDRVSEMISRYKFHNMRFYSGWLAEQIAEHLGPDIRAMRAEAIVPVPLHPSKLAARGFDQTKLLAEKLSELVHIPVAEMLVRTKATKPMKELDYESRVLNMMRVVDIAPEYRSNNIKDIIFDCEEVAEKTHIPHRVCVVDDIFTTGSTVDTCAKVLKRAGVEKVFFITAATGRS